MRILTCVLLLLPLAPPTVAQCEARKLLASDGAAESFYGASVGLDGYLAILGAPGHGVAGAAYLVDMRTGAEVFEFTPLDLPPDAQFGNAVAIDLPYVVVGAVLDDVNGAASGSVYVFDAATGLELAKLVPSDGGAFDLFGIDVDASGERILVGADGYDDPATDCGAAYLFDATNGAELARWGASDAAESDRFGGSVALDGARGVVGAWHKEVQAQTAAGSAYVFDISSGVEILQLTASDAQSWDFFGSCVGISGSYVAVGSPREDERGSNAGAAYVFDVVSGAERHKLLANDGVSNDFFGQRVAIDGELVLVGAPFHDLPGPETGSLYLFDLANEAEQLFRFGPADAASGDNFGLSVALDGVRSLAGSKGDEQGLDSGAAYVLVVGGSDCNDNGVLDDCDVFSGASLDADGNGVPDECEPTPWVKSPINGHWYALSQPSSWVQGELRAQSWGGHLATVRASSEHAWFALQFPGLDLHLGYTDVFVEGSFEWIGGDAPAYERWATGEPDDDPGAADYAMRDGASLDWYDVPAPTVAWGLVEVVSDDCNGNGVPDAYEVLRGLASDWDGNGVPDECDPANYCSANANSSGLAATMSVLGSPVVDDNDLTLVASQVAVDQFGYFLMSQAEDFVPLFGGSEGNLCVGAPIVRLGTPPAGEVQFSGADGVMMFQPDLGFLPQGIVVAPGEVWNFQAWFRDGPSSNTSDGIRIQFR